MLEQPLSLNATHKKTGKIENFLLYVRFMTGKHRLCKFPHCQTRATQNYPDQYVPVLCAKHKHPGMINITNKKCTFLGCLTEPTFNFNHCHRPISCFAHKSSEMVDVKNRKCTFPDCQTQACYRYPCKSDRYKSNQYRCAKHWLPDMVNYKIRGLFLEKERETFPSTVLVPPFTLIKLICSNSDEEALAQLSFDLELQ